MGRNILHKLFIIALLYPVNIIAQSEKNPFRSCLQYDKIQNFNQIIMTSDTINLTNTTPIYALCVNAIVQQPTDCSYIRIVLEDTEGHDYLVAESYRVINDTTVVELTDYCEETFLLNGIKPFRLKLTVKEASIELINISMSTNQLSSNIINRNYMNPDSIRLEQITNIVNRINKYNYKHGKAWIAGVTNISMLPYEQKDSIFLRLEDNDMSAFQFYSGGLFEFGEASQFIHEKKSLYVPNFNWKDRHGRDWITEVKNQGTSNSCTVFSVVGMAESLVNLYFNHILNMDLSEQDIISFGSPLHVSCVHADYIKNEGVIDEASLEFGSSPSIRPEGNENIKVSDYDYHNLSFNMTYTLDSLRKSLIQKGPFSLGVSGTPTGHEMLLVGYDTISVNNPYNISEPDIRIGRTFLILKNSWGSQWGECGFANVLFNTPANRLSDYCTMSVPITSLTRTDDDIHCEDRDGDGYFNWGIGPRPNNRLPAWAEQEEDGDDSNRLKGAMNDYGFLTDVSYPSTFVIDHNMTDSELIDSLGCSRFLRQPIKLSTGVTLTIQGDLAFYSGKKIYMNRNSTLIIDGGTLVDPTLNKSGTGCTVKIINGGKIKCHKKNQFVLPEGISMEFDEGSVFE